MIILPFEIITEKCDTEFYGSSVICECIVTANSDIIR
jgi:hypothetical protein